MDPNKKQAEKQSTEVSEDELDHITGGALVDLATPESDKLWSRTSMCRTTGTADTEILGSGPTSDQGSDG